jgi:hypothetical protein
LRSKAIHYQITSRLSRNYVAPTSQSKQQSDPNTKYNGDYHVHDGLYHTRPDDRTSTHQTRRLVARRAWKLGFRVWTASSVSYIQYSLRRLPPCVGRLEPAETISYLRTGNGELLSGLPDSDWSRVMRVTLLRTCRALIQFGQQPMVP